MVRRQDRESYRQGALCEQCGHLGLHIGLDGWCAACADRLERKELGGVDDEQDGDQ